MKIGFSTVIYGNSNLTLETIIRRGRKLQYDGIEINFTPWPSDINPQRLNRTAREEGIEILAIGTRHLFLTHGAYLSSPDEKKRDKAIQYVKECIRLADELGVSIIQIGLGYQGPKLETKREIAWRNVIKSFREVLDATDSEVSIVLEAINRFEAEFIPTMAEAIDLIKDIQNDRVMVMADAFHMNIEETSMEKSLAAAGKRLGYVHLSDSNRLAPGWGHTDFPKFIDALQRTGYTGPLVMECLPKPNADESLKQAIKYVRNVLPGPKK